MRNIVCGEADGSAWPLQCGFGSWGCAGKSGVCDNSLHPKDFSWNLGDAVGMLGKYEDDGEKKLTYWLDSAIFEDTVMYGSEYIYIQRSFANPAASPPITPMKSATGHEREPTIVPSAARFSRRRRR